MENQHEKITGYRNLSEQEIAAMNDIKALAEQAGALTESIRNRPAVTVDQRWLSIGITDLQKGFMALTRSIARPTTF